MAMSHSNLPRRIVMTALLGLSLGACSFSYSSGSSPSNAPGRSTGKPVSHAHAHTSSGKVDNRGKPISRSGSGGSGSGKSISKGDNEPDAPSRVDDDEPATRTPTAEPPKRTKVPPKRTKVPASREPTGDDDTTDTTDDDTDTTDDGTDAAVRRSPASNTTIRAKTKSDNPSASKRIVAPQ